MKALRTSKANRLAPAALALAVSMPFAANAAHGGEEWQIDTDGLGGAGKILNLDSATWDIAAMLAQNSVQEGIAGASLSWTDASGGPRLFGHGRMTGASLGPSGVDFTSAELGEFTYQFSMPVDALRVGDGSTGSTMTWTNPASGEGLGAENYFRIFHNFGSPANGNTGLGFGTSEGEVVAGTTLIAEGKIRIAGGTDIEVDDDTLTSLGPGAGGVETVELSGDAEFQVDICLTGDLRAQCAGALAGTGYIDTAWVVDTILSSLLFDVDLVTTLGAPFSDPIPDEVAQQTPTYGADGDNNFTCSGTGPCDILLEVRSANTEFRGTVVPEPTTVALMGLGMLGIGAARRRRQK